MGHFHKGNMPVADNGGQDVIEVMGDAAGKGADGFHLLHLEHLFFKFSMLRDVITHPEKALDVSPLVPDCRHKELNSNVRTVLADTGVFLRPASALAGGLAKHGHSADR